MTGDTRVGIGVDTHRLVPAQSQAGIVLGGVLVPCDVNVAAHSDGDVLVHAVMDALLGATARGDLGSYLGVDRPELAGARSVELLAQLVRELALDGWVVSNVDSTIIAQRPRLAAAQTDIRRGLADALGMDIENVSVKVTSTDGTGDIGQGDAIGAQAVALMRGA